MGIKKIVRFLQIVHSKDAIKNFLALKKLFSISSFRINAVASDYQLIFKTIIDVGSNVGQFALAAARRFPMAKIYCFEPVPDVYAALEYNLRNLNNVETVNCAIGNEEGDIEFYRNEYTLASSAMKMISRNKHYNCDEQCCDLIKVKISKLDNIFPEKIKRPVLLKLDVQGFEKLALKGAQRILKQIDCIVLEMSFVKLYEKQPLFSEIHEYLTNIGFEILVPVDVNEGKNFEIVEMDVLYRRTKNQS